MKAVFFVRVLVCLGRGGDLGLETGMETKSDLYPGALPTFTTGSR